MKIHLIHNYVCKGWKEFGAFTQWVSRCECGSEIRRIEYIVNGKQPTFTLIAMIFVIVSALTFLFFFMYVNGIYPFEY